ncbi:MAG: hypothetical protein PF961_03545 [Planctomycetota bacterium]|nr:hypothetical protein [Planctomycetota bacterium]
MGSDDLTEQANGHGQEVDTHEQVGMPLDGFGPRAAFIGIRVDALALKDLGDGRVRNQTVAFEQFALNTTR